MVNSIVSEDLTTDCCRCQDCGLGQAEEECCLHGTGCEMAKNSNLTETGNRNDLFGESPTWEERKDCTSKGSSTFSELSKAESRKEKKIVSKKLGQMPVPRMRRFGTSFEWDAYAELYFGAKSTREAELICSKPTSFRFYHRLPNYATVNDLEEKLPLCIVYKTFAGEYYHFSITTRLVATIHSRTQEKKYQFAVRIPKEKRIYFNSISALARYYSTYTSLNNGNMDIFPLKEKENKQTKKHASVSERSLRSESSCPDMCPEKERYVRQLGNHLHQYEVFPNGRINPAATVKDYARSAADQDEPLSHELRPPEVLNKTMDYLISKINASVTKQELPRLYDFIWSRSRSIRKEITQQQLTDKVAVGLVEKCARFHIYASYAMAGFDVKDFDARMNTENLSKCLQTLRHLYDDLAKKAIFCETEAEFRAYDVLLNLSNSNVLSVASSYRQEIQDSPEFCLAMRLACNFQCGNYVAFFRLVSEKATYMQAALCYMLFDQMRLDALRLIVRVYKSPAKYSLSTFADLLEFDSDEEARVYVEGLDMTVDDGMISYSSSTDFQQSSTEAFGKYVVQKKLAGPLANVIANGDVTTPHFPPPINSFTVDGYYENDPVLRNFFASIEPSLNLRAVRRYSSATSERTAPVEIKHPADPAFRDSPPPFNEEPSPKSAFSNPFDKSKTDTHSADGRMAFGGDKSAFNVSLKQKLIPSRLGSDQPSKQFGGFSNPLKGFMDKARLPFMPDRSKSGIFSDAMNKLKPTVKSEISESGNPKSAFGFQATPKPPIFGSSRLLNGPSDSANSASFNFTSKASSSASLIMPIPTLTPAQSEQPPQKTAEELAEEKRIREKAERDAKEAEAKAERQRHADEERRRVEAEVQQKRQEEERRKRLLAEHERRRKEAEEKATEEERQRKAFRKERAHIFKNWAPQTAKWLHEELLEQAFNSIINNTIQNTVYGWKEEERKAAIIRRKHDLRIVKPFAQKWIDLLHWRIFMRKLSLKRHSPVLIPVPPKRSKLFPTPEIEKDSDDESESEEAGPSNRDTDESEPTDKQAKSTPGKPRTFAQYMNDYREEDLRKTEAQLNPEIPLGEDEELVIDPDDEPEYLQDIIADSLRDYEKMDEATLNKRLAKMNLSELDEAKLLKMLNPDELKAFQRMADEMFNIPNQSCFK